MQTYKEYKETGLAWLERIPKHWRVVRNKNFLTEITLKNEDEQANLLGVSQYTGVTEKKNATNMQGSKKSESLVGYKCVKEHQLVINIMLTWNGSLGISKYTGVVSPAYAVFSIADEVNPWFIHYLFRCPHLTKYFKAYSTGVIESRLRLYPETLFLLFSILPPREEQDKIVQFLDHKLEKIHKFIANKQKLIALLEEQKQVIINQAVTKGLDLNAPMKDSGIDWLGEVPKHWEVMRCKYLFKERNERSAHGDETHLSMSQKYGLVPDDKLDEKRMLSESYAGGKLCYENDMVLNRLKAHLGVFALSKQMGVISPDYTVLIVNTHKLNPKFTELLLKSNSFRKELRVRVRGVVEGFWRLYTEDFNTIYFPFPSLREQEQIVEHLNVACTKSDTLIAKYQKEIDLVQEYKTSLISAVVTGQVNVGT